MRNPLPGTFYIYTIAPCLTTGTAGPYFITMLLYQSFGQFKKQAYKVYTTAEHLAAYREDLPTRRRQLNAVNRDIENMREAIATIARQLEAGNLYAHYLGDKYTDLDLYDMREDLANLEEARAIIFEDPCPKKIEKQNAAISAAHDAAQDEQPQPLRVTLELPAGVTLFDLDFIFDLARDAAHKERMAAYQEYSGAEREEQTNELFEKSHKKADYLSKYYNAAVELGNITHRMAWKLDPTTPDQCIDQIRILEK